jgi:ubiquinone/menaquinone biosynthesis C-methylase UbiE
MKFKQDFLFNYSQNAPLALAIERSIECEIMSRQQFTRPILDIGCGDGLFAFILFNERIDLGIDPNPRELKQAREYGMYKELIQCPGSDIPKDSGSFRTVFCNSVLEHIQGLQSVLDEAYRLLAPGGKLYATIPTDKFDHYSLLYQIFSFMGLSKSAEDYRRLYNSFWKHINYHSKDEWMTIFSDSGFEEIASQEYASRAVCSIDDFLVPFAFVSFITKKTTNRWILSPRLRKYYIYPLYLTANHLVKEFEKGNNGGIAFFSLLKG